MQIGVRLPMRFFASQCQFSGKQFERRVLIELLICVARSEGFEPPTLGIEIRCSIQLSYERVRVRLSDLGVRGQRPREALQFRDR
jgi:hypothetical protein